MRHIRYVLFAAAGLASCSAGGQDFAPSDFVRVSCSSNDGGKTCFGYGQLYEDGTSDACGRVPGGPEFALKLTYRMAGKNTVCETVSKSSNPDVMPVGETFCSVYLERRPNEFTYRFQDDPTTRLRHSYNARQEDKWCQPLINALH